MPSPDPHFLRACRRGLQPGTAIGDLRQAAKIERPKLPKKPHPGRLEELMRDEKVARAFRDRFEKTVEEMTERIAKAAAQGRPAYSNPFSGPQSRYGYGERGEHAPLHSKPYKASVQPGYIKPELRGLRERARAMRVFKDRRERQLREQGLSTFINSLGGATVGAGLGAATGGVAGGLLGGIPGAAVGATGGGLLGGSLGYGFGGAGRYWGERTIRKL